MRNTMCCVLVGVCFATLNSSFAGDGNEPLQFKNEIISIAQVPSGKVASGEFEFKNASERKIVIKKVLPSCSCTTGKLSNSSLLPGEAGKVPFTVNTDGRTAPFKTEMAVLYSDGSDEFHKVLSIKVDVTIDGIFQAMPKVLYSADVLRGATDESELTIRQLGVSAPRSSLIGTSGPEWIKTEIEEQGPKLWKCKLHIRWPDKIGQLSEKIAFKTNSEAFPSFDVPILAYVQGEVVAEPHDVLELRTPDSFSPVSFNIRSQSGEPITVHEVKLDQSLTEALTCKVVDTRFPSQKSIVLEKIAAKTLAAGESVHGKLVVEAVVAEKSVDLEVPVVIVIKS